MTARTPSGAFERGLYEVDYGRGVLNFLINKRTAFRMSLAETQQAVNKLIPGPIHTVHTSRGKPATETVWYELYHVDQVRLFNDATLLNKLGGAAQKIRKQVKESAYARDIELGFVRYTRALDCRDYATAFTRLWTTIEYLAGTSDHEMLVGRIASLTRNDERSFVETVLRHLRDVRNGVVHVDSFREHTDTRNGMEMYLYQLKVFAERLLLFHLQKGRKYKSRTSALELLDTPTDPEELRRLIKLYRSMLRHRA